METGFIYKVYDEYGLMESSLGERFMFDIAIVNEEDRAFIDKDSRVVFYRDDNNEIIYIELATSSFTRYVACEIQLRTEKTVWLGF